MKIVVTSSIGGSKESAFYSNINIGKGKGGRIVKGVITYCKYLVS
jgi:hypothetical protein